MRLKEKINQRRMDLRGKDLLAIENLIFSEIELILNTAAAFKSKGVVRDKALQEKTAVLLFYEPSTRTRLSFELAAQKLGMITQNMEMPYSSAQKGESLYDTGKTLEAMGVDFMVIRHPENGAPESLAGAVKAHVINAGDGSHEHPTQALLDLFTLKEKKGKIKDLKVAIIGDILYSRVARSDVWALTKLGAKLVVCGPKNLMPESEMEAMGVKVTADPQEALENADAVIALRLQRERHAGPYIPSLTGYFGRYGLDQDLLKLAKKDCIVMHPGPMNRNVEIADEVADGSQSVILDQVANGVWVRMAILSLLGKN